MRRFFFYSLGAVVLLWILLQLGLLPPVLARVVGPVVGLVCSLSLPLVFIMLYAAPGFLDDLRHDMHRFTSRFRSRRLEIEELQRRIAQLDKPHHMLELAKLLSSLGKPAQAIPWYQRVLEREPDTLEARYLLGLARAETGDINGAAELLEAVHARKPDHDYGQAYLRLAQVQARRR
jgi:tetratricopeptide (TPR) repeat protein